MDLRIKGKKAIMAGGSAGMGRATAERLAEAGVELFITARREERLKSAAAGIAREYGVSVTPVVADSSKNVTPDMWRESIETALVVRPHFLANNRIPAGFDEHFERAFSTDRPGSVMSAITHSSPQQSGP